ncbi:TetR/AcrR family transcriptional regulator [Epilithonimonas xixisoli]|uniref:TetR family transcriptional regulator n=1 Tax=Epilithonimonas xixisoli TaxID=1476462 RepID=A0A4R8IJV1_9FLAO|nr:TetR/AcrR family transcriptional regulator [Epilithonimonas xixisoli]TDX87303.1 TetR family transcriptional regulator [Epilithonimonas xixisoli]
MPNPKKQTPAKKERKVNSGPIREKARTMQKMVDAVGTVLQTQGYPGLTIANVTAQAGVDRRLVSTYFGNIDSLVATYLKQNDYWETTAKQNIDLMLQHPDRLGKAEIIGLLQGQFDAVMSNEVMQKTIHWELGEQNKTLRELADRREDTGEPVLRALEKNFANTNIDLRAIIALQISGLYYLSLHAKANGSTFCGIDINEADGKERISKAVEMVVEMVYEKEG